MSSEISSATAHTHHNGAGGEQLFPLGGELARLFGTLPDWLPGQEDGHVLRQGTFRDVS